MRQADSTATGASASRYRSGVRLKMSAPFGATEQSLERFVRNGDFNSP